MPLSIRDFRQQHDQLLMLADRLQAIINGGIYKNAPEAEVAIVTLAAYLRLHLKAEEGLYTELLKSPDEVARSTARRFENEMGGLGNIFSQYVDEWTLPVIEANYENFKQSSDQVLQALRNRIHQENTLLYALATDMAVSDRKSSGATVVKCRTVPLICVVDDHPGDFLLLTEAWRSAEVVADLEHSCSSRTFLDRAERDPTPGLVIIDINMPDMNGMELLKRLRSMPAYSRIPLVLSSTASHPQDIEAAYALGATGYFSKPNTFDGYAPFVQAMKDLIAYHTVV
jgi:CheY-like chemotaxis protein